MDHFTSRETRSPTGDDYIGESQSAPSVNAPCPLSSKVVEGVLAARRQRGKFFDHNLFADPAWDMLLELYSAELRQTKMSVSSLCLGSNVPTTTALRWIQMLERIGLLQRASDPTDGRRFFVSLTDYGSQAMSSYFQAVKWTSSWAC